MNRVMFCSNYGVCVLQLHFKSGMCPELVRGWLHFRFDFFSFLSLLSYIVISPKDNVSPRMDTPCPSDVKKMLSLTSS